MTRGGTIGYYRLSLAPFASSRSPLHLRVVGSGPAFCPRCRPSCQWRSIAGAWLDSAACGRRCSAPARSVVTAPFAVLPRRDRGPGCHFLVATQSGDRMVFHQAAAQSQIRKESNKMMFAKEAEALAFAEPLVPKRYHTW